VLLLLYIIIIASISYLSILNTITCTIVMAIIWLLTLQISAIVFIDKTSQYLLC